jgi:hypothetical protein
MAYTSSDLIAIEEALASGVLEVQYTDKRVKYRSLRDLIALRELIKRELGIKQNKIKKKTAVTSKGL